MVAVDTLRVRYNLLSLLRKTIHLTEVRLSHPVLHARRDPDGTWDLLSPFGRDTTATASSITVQIDDISMDGGGLTARPSAATPDSSFRIEQLGLRAHDIRVGAGSSAVLDTLHASYAPPGQTEWTSVRMGGSLLDDVFTLSGFELSSSHSQMTASGRLRLPGEGQETVNDIDFTLDAAPLHFADIHSFLPSVDPTTSATITVQASGTGRELAVNAEAGMSDGSTVAFEGVVSPLTSGPLTFVGDVRFSEFDPSFMTAGTAADASPATQLTGSAAFDLAGPSLDSLRGTLDASLTRSTFSGISIPSARLEARIDSGEVSFDATSGWDGGMLAVNGSIQPFSDIPSYAVRGRMQGLNAARIGATEHQTDVNATFSVDGHGFDPRSAEVVGLLHLSPSMVNASRIDEGRLEMNLENGALRYGIRFVFPDGLLAANGDAAFTDSLTFSVRRGQFRNVDVAALLGAEAASSLTGTFTARGVGIDPGSMTLDAGVVMEASTYGPYHLLQASLQAGLAGGTLRLNLSADLEEAGRYAVVATGRPFEETPRIDVTSAEFSGVQLSALLQDDERSGVFNGTATFTARGTSPQTAVVDGRINLSDSRFRDQSIDAARFQVRLARGLATFDADVAMPDGSVRLAGRTRPFQDVPNLHIDGSTFENVNVGALMGDPAFETRLSGTASVSATGADPSTLTADGRIELTASRINDQIVDTASVSGSMSDGSLVAHVFVQLPDGLARLTATASPFAETPTYAIEGGTFEGIDIGRLAGRPDWTTDLAGSITLAGSGFDPDDIVAEGTLTLSRSVIQAAVLQDGTLNVSLSGGNAQIDVNLRFEEGSAELEGGGRFFAEEPEYRIAGSLSNVPLSDLLGIDGPTTRLTGTIDLDGSGTNPGTMALRGVGTLDASIVEGTSVENAHAAFALDRGLLRVDSLLVRSAFLNGSGSGRIALWDSTASSDFQFSADVFDLGPLRRYAAAENLQLDEGHFIGRVYGPPGALRFDAEGSLTNFIYDTVRFSAFEGTVAGEIDPDLGLSMAEMEGSFVAISLPAFLVNRADLRLTYGPNDIRFDGDIFIEQGRSGSLRGYVDPSPDARRVVLEAVNLTLDGREWELLQEAVISYGDAYRVSGLLLHSGDDQLAIDGIIDPTGNQNFIVTAENVSYGAIADLLGYEGLSGVLNGSLVLTGPAASPTLDGSLRAEIASFGARVGRLDLGLDYADLRLNVDAVLTHVDGSTLDVDGYVPADLRVARLTDPAADDGEQSAILADESVNLTLVADRFAVGWIEPFLDPATIDDFEGRLAGNVRVTGTMASPELLGTATFTEGSLALTELGLTYSDIQAEFDFQQNVVQVTDFLVRSGRGRARGSGSVNLTELTLGEFDVSLNVRDFLAIQNSEYRFVVDGDMQLSGTTDRPVLQGRIEVASGEIFMTEETTATELEQVMLTEEHLQTVERRFGLHVTEGDTTTFSLYDALAMDLNVAIERNTWIRSRVNPIMDIQFSGNLDLSKEHYQDAAIFGTIEVVPQRSRIIQFGKRFDIASGTLTFNGPATDPQIDIEAEYVARPFRGQDPGVTITLGIEGRMSEQLDLTLGSDPPLEYTDIVSYIATGQPASSDLYLGGAGSTLLGTGTGLALQQLTAIMEGIAESGLGLDVVTLEQRSGGEYLTAGSYVSPRLFVSVSQPINLTGNETTGDASSSNRPLFTIEYELQRWLLVRLTQQNQTLRLNLQFEYAY
ncbi:MAG: translocation/assembly module TamB domain-containing protein [Rhodothermales bacterium]